MTPRFVFVQITLLVLGIGLSCAHAGETESYFDPAGDALVRRTDQGSDGPVPAMLPDLRRLDLRGWQAFNPSVDPFSGQGVRGDEAHLVRIDLTFEGLVNPPGTLGLSGLAYEPLRYGPAPVFGFIELDTDRDKDTGGQLGGAATLRFLANAARFGGRPQDSIGQRAATSADDYDSNFYSEPYYERSGEDFAVVLCGCHEVTIASEGGDQDGTFEQGETWIVRGRFFQRAAGYQDASIVLGGSAPGLYDPEVSLRFEHRPGPDETLVSLVFPLDMQGAAALEGEPVQSIDSLIGGSSHFSVIEAIQDLIDGAEGQHGPLPSDVEILVERWEGEDAEDGLDPTDWEPTALLGTAYLTQQDSLYVWTDVGFEVEPGDFNGDSTTGGPLDQQALENEIDALDGGPRDADGKVNGEVEIQNFGINFSLFDVDSDGVITADELDSACPADLAGGPDGGPDGMVTSIDFLQYLNYFAAGDPAADLTGGPGGGPDGIIGSNDFLAYLDYFAAGCP